MEEIEKRNIPIYCENEIKEEEIDNIYRIEFMPSSNWSMGYNREIWVVEFEEDKATRSLYIGDPLVPEYSRYNNEPEIDISFYEDDNLVFANHFSSYDYLEFLYENEIWKWPKMESAGRVIDGENLDIAFFTRDKDGNDKVCRYQCMEEMALLEFIDKFSKFFETMSVNDIEHVRLNKEMMDRSSRLQPGGHEDKKK